MQLNIRAKFETVISNFSVQKCFNNMFYDMWFILKSINTQLDFNFIFFIFYHGLIVAVIMITCQILVYFVLFEHILKMIRNIYVILRAHKVFKLHKLKVSLGKSLNGCNSAIMGSCYLKFYSLLFFYQVDHISKTKANSWWSLSHLWNIVPFFTESGF